MKKCTYCGGNVFPVDNKGNNLFPICPSCECRKKVRQNQYANIQGNQNVINQNITNSPPKICYFCSNDATTHCVDCGKLLCEIHKHTYWSRDRCSSCHILQGGKTVGNGAIGVIKGVNKFMRWGSSLICP